MAGIQNPQTFRYLSGRLRAYQRQLSLRFLLLRKDFECLKFLFQKRLLPLRATTLEKQRASSCVKKYQSNQKNYFRAELSI